MIEIRHATEQDRPQIIACCRQVFGPDVAAATDAQWIWQWRQDPRLPSPGVRGNVALFESQLIGALCFIPAGLYIHGEPVDAWWGSIAMIDKTALRRALRTLRNSGGRQREQAVDNRGLSRRLYENDPRYSAFLGKHVAQDMRREAAKSGVTEIEGAGVWSRTVSRAPKLRSVVGGRLARLLAAPIDLLLHRLPRTSPKVRIMRGQFDGRFDVHWNVTQRSYAAIARRDAAVLNWRFRQRPGVDYTVLEYGSEQTLGGYAVVRTVTMGSAMQGKIVDLLTHKDDADARQHLLVASLRALREMGAERVYCYASHPALIASLLRLRFQPRRSRDPLLRLNLPAMDYYITEGDGDGS